MSTKPKPRTPKKAVSGKNIKNNKNTIERQSILASDSIIREVISIIGIAISILILFSLFGKDSVGALGYWINNVLNGLFGMGAYILPFLIIGICIYILFDNNREVPGYKIFFSVLLFVAIIGFINIVSSKNAVIYENAMDYVKAKYTAGSAKNGGLIGSITGDFLHGIFGSFSYVLLISLSIIFSIIITGKSFFKGVSKSYTVVKDKIDEVAENVREDYEIEYSEGFQRKKKEKVFDMGRPKKYEEKEIKAEKEGKKIVLFKNNEDREVLFSNVKQMEEENKVIEFNPDTEIRFKGIELEPEPQNDVFKFEMGKNIDKEEKFIETQTEEKPKKTRKKEKFEAEEIIIPEKEENEANKKYEFPPAQLLQMPPIDTSMNNSKKVILENSKKLEDTLKSFGVEAKVIEVSRGPTVTRYELAPGPGVKVSKISGLADDLALNLAAQGIRIEAPIPGKAAVGIEVPNKETQTVFFRDIIEDEIFKKFPSKIAFGLGKDIAGKTVVTDIGKMPHLLIAGATGSGKSVCINTLITSILYKAKPDEVKLIMVDPKVVELSVYSGIPHLLIPVVTEPKKAAGALNWAVSEMLRRYELFAQNSVRDLKGYNAVALEKEDGKQEPQIVIIIDELADLMMAAPGEVEDSICRLAQMARAAGIHLIIATQRPSVDVITGIIKANIPSRLAFSVSSGTDSRTILDTVGAEKLLGRGDMLFYPVGTSKPIRIQGAFISDREVEGIVDFLKQDNEQEFDEEMIAAITSSSKTIETDEDTDEHFEAAVEFVIQKEKASASMLQRQFRIGYNRASRLVEDLENKGIIGPEDGSKPRKVLINYSVWQDMKSGKTDSKEVEEEIEIPKKIEKAEETIKMISSAEEEDTDTDEFFESAVEFAIDNGEVSAYMLQREFRIGYNRAENLIEDLETKRIIATGEGNEPQKVLITYAMWEDMKGDMDSYLDETHEEY